MCWLGMKYVLLRLQLWILFFNPKIRMTALMEFIIVTGVTGVRVLNLLDTNFLSIMWSCAQGRSSHFGFGKYLFDKIRTSGALKVISSFVEAGEGNVTAIDNGKTVTAV